MLSFIVRRLFSMAMTLFFVSILSFILIELPPGDAVSAEIDRLRGLGSNVTPDQIRALEEQFNINDPPLVKYWDWVSGVVVGDFGYSIVHKQPVANLIMGRLAFSVLLATIGLFFSWIISIPLGVYSATHRNTLPDYIITAIQFVGVAVPEFLVALVLMVFISRTFGWDVDGLFSNQYENAPWSFGKVIDLLSHLWLPVFVISLGATAWQTRIMRANLLDTMNAQYVQTARAKGLKENTVIWKHAVRNALHPLIMALGGVLPALISGEVIASIVLNLPTLGPLLIDSLKRQDMYLAIAILMMTSILLVIGNLLADLLLAWVDPRVRLE